MPEEIKERLIKNTFYSSIGYIWTLLVAFFLTPYIFHHIGAEKFGIMIIIGIPIGWLRMLDGGVSFAFVNYFSESYALKDYKRFNTFFSAGIVFYILFSSIFIIPAILFGESIINPLVSTNARSEVFEYFKLVILSFGLININALVYSAINGIQKMDLASKIGITLSIPNIVGTVFFLESGYGIIGLAINGLILGILNIGTVLIFLTKFNVSLSFLPKNIKIKVLGELLSLGYKILISRVINLFFFSADRFFIGTILKKLETVTFYQFGGSFLGKLSDTILMLVSAVIPTTSYLTAIKDKDKVTHLLMRGSKYLAIISFPTMIFAFFFADELMIFWMNKRLDESAFFLRILFAGYLSLPLSSVMLTIGTGAGRPGIQAKASVIALLVCLSLYLFIFYRFDATGVAISITIGLSFFCLYYMFLFRRFMWFSIGEFLKYVIYKPLFISLVGLIPLILIKFLERYYSFGSNRWECLLILFPCFIFYCLFFVVVTSKTKLIDAYDKEIFKNILSKASSK